MYEGDSTTIQLGKMRSNIEVTSGIRQGCSISTLLFKMVTFTMIEEINNRAVRYKKGKYDGISLWLADDATIIPSSVKDLLEALDILKLTGRKNGLGPNREKTKIMVIRGTNINSKIGDYEVVEEVKYLGIQLGGRGKDIFGAENKTWLEKAEKRANALIGQVKSSCDMVVVGKAIWKAMDIPAALYDRAVIPTSEKGIKKLQRIKKSLEIPIRCSGLLHS